MDRFIPLSIPNFEGNERKYVDDALEQGWVSTGGAYITKLEQQLAGYINTHSVAACQSGTSAIHLSLIDCGVGPGDMVIVPALTFIAAVNPVKYQFAEPVFMDCDDSLCMDPVKLRNFCEAECEIIQDSNPVSTDKKNIHNNRSILIHKATGKPVKAIIVVHVFGNMADMEEIMYIASKYNLAVIEDATEALGTHYTAGFLNGKFAGTIGDYGAYSFNGNKIITTGGGGAVTANNPECVAHMKYLSTQAKDDEHYYVHNEIGYNYRMTNLQAALGVAQLEELPEFINRKQENYKLYMECFKDFEYGTLLSFREGTYSNQWFYSLEIDMPHIDGSLRDIITHLQNKGVQTRAIWALIHEQQPYIDSIAFNIDRAKYYSERVLNIPCSTNITRDDIIYTADAIKTVLGDMARD